MFRAHSVFQDLSDLADKKRKEMVVIYVSVDIDQKEMKSVLSQKPWASMVSLCVACAMSNLIRRFISQTFHDGSDFATIGESQAAQMSELLRNEDFVPASDLGDIDIPAEGEVDPYVSSIFRKSTTSSTRSSVRQSAATLLLPAPLPRCSCSSPRCSQDTFAMRISSPVASHC